LDEITDIRAELLMLRHVTESLWTNFIANSGPDPLGTCRRVAEESLQSLDSMYERMPASEGVHITIQSILHHEESFWRSVEFQVASRTP
jgi:hypothetical protein